MRYYAKIGYKDDPDNVLKKFTETGIDAGEVILDTDKQQKKRGSTYMTLKDELRGSCEPLFIDSLFSLGKNAREVAKEVGWFKENDIRLYILDVPASLDPDMLTMELLYEVNKVYASREIENLKNGQNAAAHKNKKAGRPLQPYPPEWETLFEKYENKEITSAEFIERTGLSRGTFFNMQRRYLQERRMQNRELNGNDENKLA